MELGSSISKIKFNPCIMNASGPRSTEWHELIELGNSRSGAIVIKSATFEPRGGNPKPRYFEDSFGALQSMGLPNLGYKKYVEFIPKLKEKFDKPIIASVAGFDINEYVTMAKSLSEAGADMIEVNLSCPNIAGKPLLGYDIEASEEVLSKVKESIDKPISVKMPPYLDSIIQKKMVEVLEKTKVNCIVSLNSPGNTCFIDPEKEEFMVKPKFGGLCGKYIKPIALGNIRRFYELTDGKIPVIGVGGINSGADVFEHLLAGASAVQIGSVYQNQGLTIFERLEKELKEILEKKRYSSVSEVIGKLKAPSSVHFDY